MMNLSVSTDVIGSFTSKDVTDWKQRVKRLKELTRKRQREQIEEELRESREKKRLQKREKKLNKNGIKEQWKSKGRNRRMLNFKMRM